MYLGQHTETLPLYIDTYHKFLGMTRKCVGSQQRTLYCYRCEACGSEARCVWQAEEDFYCKCGKLISVEEAPCI